MSYTNWGQLARTRAGFLAGKMPRNSKSQCEDRGRVSGGSCGQVGQPRRKAGPEGSCSIKSTFGRYPAKCRSPRVAFRNTLCSIIIFRSLDQPAQRDLLVFCRSILGRACDHATEKRCENLPSVNISTRTRSPNCSAKTRNKTVINSIAILAGKRRRVDPLRYDFVHG